MSETAAPARWVAYSFAVLCVVPHPHLGTAIPVGVILHARTAQFLGIRVLMDEAAPDRGLDPADLDLAELVGRGILGS